MNFAAHSPTWREAPDDSADRDEVDQPHLDDVGRRADGRLGRLGGGSLSVRFVMGEGGCGLRDGDGDGDGDADGDVAPFPDIADDEKLKRKSDDYT